MLMPQVWYSWQWFNPVVWQSLRLAHPLYLYLLPLPILLLLLRNYLNRARRQQLTLSFDDRLRQSGFRVSAWEVWVGRLRYLLPGSIVIAYTLLLVALARPQVVNVQRETIAEGLDIMLAMDVSASMAETDLTPNRLAVARTLARNFVDKRKNDRIGLVIFAGEAFSICPLTTDYDLLKTYLADLNVQMIRTSGTAIGDALARCINRMRGTTPATDTTQTPTPKQSKLIVLLSDGDNTAGNLDPDMAARLAKTFGIRIYTIAVGRETTKQDGITTADEGILKNIATIGQGRFFRAANANRLQDVFSEIDRLEKTPIRVQIYEEVQDYYRPYLYWGVVWVLVALALKSTIVGNVLED